MASMTAEDRRLQVTLEFHYYYGDGFRIECPTGSGRGVGASHQTGWTGLVAELLQPRAEYNIRC